MKIIDIITTLMGLFSPITDQAVKDGICDFSGQGRGKDGRRAP